MDAFSFLPCVERIKIEPLSYAAVPPAHVLSRLRETRTLVELDLRWKQIGNDALVTIFRHLKSHKTLQNLRLQLDEGIEKSGAKALVDFLEKNESAKSVHLGGIKAWDWEEFCRLVAHGLANNKSLRRFRVSRCARGRRVGEEFSGGTCDAIVQLLKRNFTLRSIEFSDLVMSCFRGEKANVIEFFLSLNRLGRARVMQDPKNTILDDWIQVLSSVRNDASCLFYNLRENPSLCGSYMRTSTDDESQRNNIMGVTFLKQSREEDCIRKNQGFCGRTTLQNDAPLLRTNAKVNNSLLFRNETEREQLQRAHRAELAQVRQEYSSRISELQGEIVMLKGKVGTQEDEIATLKDEVGTLQDKVSQFDQFKQEIKSRDNCDNSLVATSTVGKRKGDQMSLDGGGSKCSRKQ